MNTIKEMMYKRRFEKIIKKYKLWTNDLSNFYESGDEDFVPDQGIKVHISAGGRDFHEYMEDYLELLEKLVPSLCEQKAVFKIANLELAKKWYFTDTIQKGKLVTLYECPFAALNFFTRNSEVLYKRAGTPIIGDKHIGGRIYIRYGSNRHRYVTNPRTGFKYNDERSSYVPLFMQDIILMDYVSACE